MSEIENLMNSLKHYTTWLETLEEMDDGKWTTPIVTGTWSISEIVSHIMFWDHHILSEIPKQKEITFPDFDSKNQVAADYAKSGITKSQLLQEAQSAREELITALYKISEKGLKQPIAVNAVTHCPRTGSPYSLFYVMEEHAEHDTYHKKQIIHFLNEKKSSLD